AALRPPLVPTVGGPPAPRPPVNHAATFSPLFRAGAGPHLLPAFSRRSGAPSSPRFFTPERGPIFSPLFPAGAGPLWKNRRAGSLIRCALATAGSRGASQPCPQPVRARVQPLRDPAHRYAGG